MGEARHGFAASGPRTGIPTGLVSFLFTDVESSTSLWENHPTEMTAALRRHDDLVRETIETNGGYVFSLAGDQFVAAFHRVAQALDASGEIQHAVAAEPWPAETPIRVRIGIHVGEADERDNDYFGPVLNRTARITSAGHGGQVLLSNAAVQLLDPVERERLVDLGHHRMKDLVGSEQLWQVGSVEFPPLRTLRSDQHNLPVERTVLVGREDEIERLADVSDRHRLVTLLGMGGTGKTRLATALAAEVADRYRDGVWFVDLVPVTSADSIAETVADVVGLRLTGSDLVGSLATQAADRHVLVVLDNCEHVTDDVADVVDELLARSESVDVIATSREPLDLPDEHHHHVSPLAVESSPGSPAVELFLAAAERVGAAIDLDDIATVAQVCERLDGIPLSLELAGAQLRQLTLHELVDRLDRRFELLTRGRQSRGRRRQTSLLDLLLDSWNLLDDAERELLRHLAAFPASFRLADVEMLTAGTSRSVPPVLGALVDRGLVANDGLGTMRLLETVKLFVRDQWAASDDPLRYLDAHVDWVTSFLAGRDDDAAYQSAELIGWAMAHYDDHRAVEDRLVVAERWDLVAALYDALRWAYSRETSQRATALIDRVERYIELPDVDGSVRGSLVLTAAAAARPARRNDWLVRGSEEAVELFEADGHSDNLAVALIQRSFVHVLRDPDRAFAGLDRARSIAAELGRPSLEQVTLAYRAHYAGMAGDVEAVRSIIDELEAIPGGLDGDNTAIMVLQAKMVANLLSQPDVAVASAEECAARTRAAGLDNDWWIHLYLATAEAAAGRRESMALRLDDARDVLARSGSDGLPDILLPYAALAHAEGRVPLARRWLAAVRSSGDRLGTGVVIALFRHLRSSTRPRAGEAVERADPPSVADALSEADRWLCGDD